MAYTYVSAIALPNRTGAQWVGVNLASLLVSDIYLKYRKVFLTLLLNGQEVFINFDQLKTEFATYNNTLSILLQSLGSRSLVHSPKLPTGTINYIKYSDVYRIGYAAKLSRIGVGSISGMSKDDLVDVEISRPGYSTDLSLLHTECLLSVNGFYHMTATDGSRAFIVDAGKSLKTRNLGHFGMASFSKIGKLSKHRFQASSIYPELTRELKDTVCFQCPVNPTGKTVFLVLGGYLILPQENVFWQSGDREFRVNLTMLPYIERLFESKNFIDLSTLNLTTLETNGESLNIPEAWNDETIRQYFALSQSFILVVNRDKLFWNKVIIRQMLIPGHFTAYQEPIYPLIAGHGRTAEYWKVKEGAAWSVTVADSWYRRYSFSKVPQEGLENISPQLTVDRPYFDSQGALLEIGAPAI